MSRRWHVGEPVKAEILCKLRIPYSEYTSMKDKFGGDSLREVGELFMDQLPDFVRKNAGLCIIYHEQNTTAICLEIYQ